MKTANSISGGKTSGYLAMKYRADFNVFSLVCLDDIKCAPKDKKIIDYVNFKLGDKYISQYGEFIATAEDDKTLYAMQDLEQLLGQSIDWVRGESFDRVIGKRYERVLLGNRKRLPSWARRFCTEEMKLLPIFLWWFENIGEKCDMRIGFRFDEFNRLENFFNNSDPTNFSIPISCNIYGQKQQKHESFKWRKCSFPLIRDGINNKEIKDYWKMNGWVGIDDLFEKRRQIEFPEISNCVGCFHKKPETIAIQSNSPNKPKIQWFADKENLGIGTWFDSRITYQTIIDNSNDWIPEMLTENFSCDSGGCHD